MKKSDWTVAAILGAVAAVLYFAGMAAFAYPGESAHLMCLWRGLDSAPWTPYPLAGFFARLFGGGNLVAPVSGAISVALVYLLAARFFRRRMGGENVREWSGRASVIAGVGAAVLFMVAPQIRAASTRLEPELFDLMWMLAAFAVVVAGGSGAKWLSLAVASLMWGAAIADSPIALVLFPLFGAAVWTSRSWRRGKAIGALGVAVVLTVAAFLAMALSTGDVSETFKALSAEIRSWTSISGWILVLSFTAVPFFVTFFSSRVAFNEEPGWMQWIFHIAMSCASILAIASPLGAESVYADDASLPVASGLFAAWTAGYLLSYWYVLTRARVRINESRDDKPVALKGRIFGLVAGSVLVAVYAVSAFFDLFMFDSRRGEFADKIAEAIIDDMGSREWLISNGTLDSHLRLAAAKRTAEGRPCALKIISLNRDLDENYLALLADVVRREGLGGERNEDLALSLSLGVLPFVQDWFSADKDIAKKAAVFGAADLWYTAGLRPVPERWFFGAGEAVSGCDRDARAAMLALLDAPKGWGSNSLRKVKNPVERMKLELRRHLGMVANNLGVFLQDAGDDEAAYSVYDEVLADIDSDNVCALVNLFEMATRGRSEKARGRVNEFNRRLQAIKDDPSRRYRLWALANYYGYIRSPEIFINSGYLWARSGRPGEALTQINRAIDFIPTDRRSVILNMMAALYASEDNRAKSRAIYSEVLDRDSRDHDALIGMMRLALLDGDGETALKYLEQATAGRENDPEAQIEIAMMHMMKHELAAARDVLERLAAASGDDLRSWSLLAAVMMQQSDDEKNPDLRRQIDRRLEEEILPQMEKRAADANDYYVQNTRAFILLRKGAENRKAARDAFLAASKSRPDIVATQDMVLGLDISLDDPVAAESHARDVLRRDRRHPLANYVMGSLALRREDYAAAETYLRKAADHQRPVAMAMNDLAEVYRRLSRYPEAEKYARKAIETDARLYVAYETLGSVLMDAEGDLAEAEANIEKACELSANGGRQEDVRMLISLARVQILRGDAKKGRNTLKRVEKRKDGLSAFELRQYEELRQNVR